MDRLALIATIAASALALIVLAGGARARGARARTGRAAGPRGPRAGAMAGPAGAVGDGWRLERDGTVVRLRLDLELTPSTGAGTRAGTRAGTGAGVAPDGEPPAALVRLARAAGVEALGAAPDAVTHVEVIDRVGRTVVTIQRGAEPLAPDEATRAAPTPRPHVPAPAPAVPAPATDAGAAPALREPASGRRPLADRLDLPPAVRAAVRQPDSPADVVRALLEAAGRPVEARGDLLVSDGVAVAFADVRDDAERALSRAYLRIEASGAARGLVVVLGFADPALVRRRDLATPNVRYVDADALSRMADAVAVGLDPVAFAAPPRPSA